MSDINIFEQASRKKLRFQTARGPLCVEDLWDLPIVSTSRATRDVKVDLNTIFQSLKSEAKDFDEHSLVEAKPNPRKGDVLLGIAIIEHISAAKTEQAKAAEKRVEQAQLRRRLAEKIADKKDEELDSLSVEELEQKLAQLSE